jgi:hypothetical protein
MALPGRQHFHLLQHVLHHVQCYHQVGVTFYSDLLDAPLSKLIFQYGIDPTTEVIAFIDSSRQDCPDTSRSTGGYKIFYMGNIIDEAITLPTPVALSSAHAEYQTGAVTMAALIAATMLIQELQGLDPDEPRNVPVKL